MTPEEQRIVIAEACGWIDVQLLNPPTPEGYRFGGASVRSFIPDYLNDLNAMHEAEKVLQSLTSLDIYVGWLKQITNDGYERSRVCATAAQRAEAFLRALGKWKD